MRRRLGPLGAALFRGLSLRLRQSDPSLLAVQPRLLGRRLEVGGGADDLSPQRPGLPVPGLAGEKDSDLAGGLGGPLLVEGDAGEAEPGVAVGRGSREDLGEGLPGLGEALTGDQREAELDLRIDVAGIQGDDLGELRDRLIEPAGFACGLTCDEEAPRLRGRAVGARGNRRARPQRRHRRCLRLTSGLDLGFEGLHLGIAGRALLQRGEFARGAVQVLGGEEHPDQPDAGVVVFGRRGEDLPERAPRLIEAALGEQREAELQPGVAVRGPERDGAIEGGDRIVHASVLAGGGALAQEALGGDLIRRLRVRRDADQRPREADEGEDEEGSHRPEGRRQWLATHATNSLIPGLAPP